MSRLSILLLLSCGIVSPVQADSLSEELDAIRQQYNVSALYLITMKGDEADHLALGTESHESSRSMTGNHYIRLGSVSKMFLGLTALKLHDAGLVDLTRPLKEYVDRLPYENRWDETHPVTLTQLIEHTAGLADMSRPEWEVKQRLSLQQAFEVDPASRRLRWQPGLHSVYSNSGAGIAAYVIEQVTDSSYAKVVANQVFKPLRLSSATFDLNDAVSRDLITGYNTDGTTPIPYWHMLYQAFGGINIRANEMSRVLRLLIDGGHLNDIPLFTAEQVRRLSTPTSSLAAHAGITYGYGLGLYQYHHRGILLVGHGGDADGYLNFIAYSPGSSRGYFLMINAFNYRAMRLLRNVVEDHLTQGLSTRPALPPADYTPDENTVRRITGRYTSVAYRFRAPPDIEVFERSEALFTRQDGEVRQLIPVAPYLFRRQGESVATIAIVAHANDIYLQSDAGNFLRYGK